MIVEIFEKGQLSSAHLVVSEIGGRESVRDKKVGRTARSRL